MANSPGARKVGDSVSVYDAKYGRWFPCKVVAISSLGGEIKMHWCGYKKSKDFWLERSSDRIGDLDKLPEVEVAGKRARDSDCEEDESCKRLRHTQKDGSPPPIENSAVDAAVESSDVRSAELLIDTLAKDLRVDSFHHPNVSDLLTEQDVSGSSPMMSPSGNSPGKSTSLDDVRVGDPARDQPHCEMCSGVIEGREIPCDRCKKSFHPRVMCLGVPETAVQVLFTTHNGSLNYVCCDCRVSSSSPPSSSPPASSPVDQGGINQLLGIVKGMLREVNTLMNEAKINRLQERNPASSHSQSRAERQSPTLTNSRKDILDGIREISEREKRKDTLVFRGFRADDAPQMISRFREVCLYLDVGHIELSEVVKINNSLFRAKIPNARDRLRLLAETRRLKGSDQYGRAFIQRDLTYQQRQEMIAKRAVRNSAAEALRDGSNIAHPMSQSTRSHRTAPRDHVSPRRNEGRVHDSSRSGTRENAPVSSRIFSRGQDNVAPTAGSGEMFPLGAGQSNIGEGRGNSRGRGGRGSRPRGRGRGQSDRFQHQIRRNAFL